MAKYFLKRTSDGEIFEVDGDVPFDPTAPAGIYTVWRASDSSATLTVAASATVAFTSTSAPSDAVTGDLVGTMSVTGVGNDTGWTFALTDDAAGTLAIDGTDNTRLEVNIDGLAPGTYVFEVQATKGGAPESPITTQATFTVTLAAPVAAGGIANQTAYTDEFFELDVSADFTGTGITYALAPGSDALPSGLSLDSAAGIISGFAAAGTANLVIRGTNNGGSDDTSFQIASSVFSGTDVTFANIVTMDDGTTTLLDGNTNYVNESAFTDTYTPAASATGVIVFYTSRKGTNPACQIGGVDADVVYSASTNADEADPIVAACFYLPVSDQTAKTISLSFDAVSNQRFGVVIASVVGGPVRGFRLAALNDGDPSGDSTNWSGLKTLAADWQGYDAVAAITLGRTNGQSVQTPSGVFTSQLVVDTTPIKAEIETGNATAAFASNVEVDFTLTKYALVAVIAATYDIVPGIAIKAKPPGYIYSEDVWPGEAGNVVIDGTYTGSAPTSVEARVVDEDGTEIVTWTAVDAAPSGGRWSGALTVPASTFTPPADPKAFKIEVRRSENHNLTAETLASYYVGMWGVAYGQSNTIIWFTNGLGDFGTIDGKAGTGWVNPEGSWIDLSGNGAPGLRTFLGDLRDYAGKPVAIVGNGRSANNIDQLGVDPNQPQNFTGFVELTAQIAANKQPLSYLLWQQGESDVNNTYAPYVAELDAIKETIATQVGKTPATFPVFVQSLSYILENSDPASTASKDDNFTNIVENILKGVCENEAEYYWCGDLLDAIHGGNGDDNFHHDNTTGVGRGERAAHMVGNWLGAHATSVAFEIASATATNATTTTVTLSHGLGNDFTPSTGINGFEVSDDGFASSIEVPSAAVRVNGSTIQLTHASLSTSGRSIRYMHGINPDFSNVPTQWGTDGTPKLGIVKDNADSTAGFNLPVPLDRTGGINCT